MKEPRVVSHKEYAGRLSRNRCGRCGERPPRRGFGWCGRCLRAATWLNSDETQPTSRSVALEGLRNYVRHAEHYGSEEVFESAVKNGGNIAALGTLALRLRNLDARWKLVPAAAKPFVRLLAGAEWSAKRIESATGYSAATARKWLTEVSEDEEEGPYLALQRATNARWTPGQVVVLKPSKRAFRR